MSVESSTELLSVQDDIKRHSIKYSALHDVFMVISKQYVEMSDRIRYEHNLITELKDKEKKLMESIKNN